jgi:PRTRC genetic system ThiF family protein
MSLIKIPEYLHNPRHSISVALVGAGGNGSEMLTKLGRMAYTLNAVYGRDLFVTLIDPDTVEEPNLGRQLFCASDLGRFKSDVLIERVNRFYGTNWVSNPKAVEKSDLKSNLVISCTDNVASRKLIHDNLRYTHDLYYRHEYATYFWLDMGNDFTSGNIILSSKCKEIKTYMPDAFEIFGDIKDNPSRPSCSLAEAIEKQHLLVNPFVADLASTLLWEVLTKPEIDYQGIYFDLNAMRVRKVPAGYYIKPKKKKCKTQRTETPLALARA